MRNFSVDHKSYEGFSLVELLVTLGIFTVVVGSVAFFATDSYRASGNAQMRVRAMAQIQEASHVIQMNKDSSWATILYASEGSVKHIEYTEGHYIFEDGLHEQDGVSLGITVEDVCRDSNGEIVFSGGTVDFHSKKIVITATWLDIFGNLQEMRSEFYLNDWNTLSWTDTTVTDFSMGVVDQVEIVAEGDGAIQLMGKLYANWCLPELMISSYDLPGDAVGNVVNADPGNVYVGTGKEFSDPGAMSFMHMTATNDDPPVVDVTGTYSGYAVNDIFGEPGFAYLATTDNVKEVVILDITQDPFVEVGSFDAPDSGDGLSVYVSDNIGYVSQGRYVHAFDLSSKNGSRPLLGSIRASPSQLWFMTALVTDIVVVNDYMYCSLYNDWYEMTIVNVSNPASMSIVEKADFNWAQATALYIQPDGNRGYIGTGSTGGDEFFIINTENKSNVFITGSYDTNGMSVKGLSVNGLHAILVGRNGEEYQVVIIEDELNPYRCGGMNVNSGISDVATLDYDGTVYSYILTGDVASEFKIIRGGLQAGGGTDGRGYFDQGTFTSRVFDSESEESRYYYVNWVESLDTNTDIRIQFRSGENSDMTGESWIGPDGTDATFFSNADGEVLPEVLSQKRYIQYRVFMTSDTDHTPLFNELTLTFQ